MRRSSRGIGLIELMVAMTLGLVIVLGVTQIFLAARNTYQSQNAAASIQEDGRFLMSKMAQEIRMTGFFGCQANPLDTTPTKDFTAAYAAPITITRGANNSVILTLITADVGNNGTNADWNILTDCRSFSTAYIPANMPAAVAGQQVIPIRRIVYTFSSNQVRSGNVETDVRPLIGNVLAFDVTFGMASSAANLNASTYVATPTNFDLIRSVRISLQVADQAAAPNSRAQTRTFNTVIALRNRLL